MIFTEQLRHAQQQNNSLLCVGLDPEPSKFPGAWKGQSDRIYDFCAAIVDATKDLVCAFKPQIAYFAAHRAEDQLERLMAHMRRVAPQVPVILDAKRGDIGSTAEQYAREAFERYQADAVTLSPFMGFDSMEPYLKYEGKGVFLLCRTSNPGGSTCRTCVWPISRASRACTSTLPSRRKARGTPMGKWAWWWARHSPKRSPGCANWPPRCLC
jgi:orotidine-5'-phosphate decarboxylase